MKSVHWHGAKSSRVNGTALGFKRKVRMPGMVQPCSNAPDRNAPMVPAAADGESAVLLRAVVAGSTVLTRVASSVSDFCSSSGPCRYPAPVSCPAAAGREAAAASTIYQGLQARRRDLGMESQLLPSTALADVQNPEGLLNSWSGRARRGQATEPHLERCRH